MSNSTTPDVVDMLTADHHEVLELVSQIRATDDTTARRDMTDTVIAELVRHSVAEEMYVYPAMREHLPDGDAAVQHDIEEHQQLEETMKALESLDTGDADFLQALDELEQVLRDHVTDEETEQFPALRQHLSAEQLQEIGHMVETAKQVAPTRPHPGAPHSALFHKTVGTGVGMIDKLRDVLSGRSQNT
jgi:hemerythrin-like domain-containing protein